MSPSMGLHLRHPDDPLDAPLSIAMKVGVPQGVLTADEPAGLCAAVLPEPRG